MNKYLPRLLVCFLAAVLVAFLLPLSARAQEPPVWEQLYSGVANFIPSNRYELVADSIEPNILYLATGSGLYRSVDSGRSWQIWAFAGDSLGAIMSESGGLWVGLDDSAGGSGWLLRSNDGGNSWQILSPRPYPAARQIKRAGSLVYVGDSTRVYRSADNGETWQTGAALNGFYQFAVDSENNQILYAADGSYGFKKSLDGGQTWQQIDLFCGWAAGCFHVYEVLTPPNRGNEVFVRQTLSAMGGDVLYRYNFFSDGSFTRQVVLNNLNFGGLVFDSEGKGYVMTDQIYVTAPRLYQSDTSGTNWQVWNQDLPEDNTNRGVLLFSSKANSLFIHRTWMQDGLRQFSLKRRVLGQVAGASTDPVIFVPGMGASINAKVFFGSGPDTWDFVPGVQVYDGLIASLGNAGYVLGDNLEIAYYDWRGHLRDSACNYVKPVIDKVKARTGASKVRLVGHSMGGLASRIYIQSDCYQDDVSRLVTVGTPHLGAVDAYQAWEGGKLVGFEKLPRIAATAYLKIIGIVNMQLADVTVIQNNFPSVGELLPSFNYLVDQSSGSFISYKETKQAVNEYMWEKNEQLSNFPVIPFYALGGRGVETLESMVVKPRPWYELTKWADGQPVAYNNVYDGDVRVLLKSALPAPAVTLPLGNYNHQEIISETINQKEILDTLGISPAELVAGQVEEDEYLSFFLGSPATVLVTAPNGEQIGWQNGAFVNTVGETAWGWGEGSEVKWVVIANPQNGNYQAEILGTGEGDYHLWVEDVKDDQADPLEQEVFGEASVGSKQTVSFDLTSTQLELVDPQGDLANQTLLVKTANLQDYLQGLSLPKASWLLKQWQLINKFLEKGAKLSLDSKPRLALGFYGQALGQMLMTRLEVNRWYKQGWWTAEQVLEYKQVLQPVMLKQMELYNQTYQNGQWPAIWEQLTAKRLTVLTEKFSKEEALLPGNFSENKLTLLAEIFSQVKEEGVLDNGQASLLVGESLLGEFKQLVN